MSESRSSLFKNKHNALFNIALYIVKLTQIDEAHIALRSAYLPLIFCGGVPEHSRGPWSESLSCESTELIVRTELS